MTKIKKRKHIDSDAIAAKKNKVETKKLNPFEVHVNKEKFKILGRKCKHDRGLPGVSRSKAIQKRKHTLGKEYQELHKVNKFKDHRIGGGAPIDDEEIASARFVAEKISQFKTKKGDIFNLNDDEVLTHRGQTLEEIEQFQDPVSDDSEDETLDAEFTEAAHFGGDNEKVDRKALIEEKILESKRKKAEILKEKEAVHEMTTKLDSSYKEILSLIGKMKKSEDEQKPKQDDYDRALKEMIFEPRGEVTDKLQSEEEIARKEKQRLEELENQRLKRMLGEDENVSNVGKPKHRSADDLDDGYLVEMMDNENEEGTLAYELQDKADIVQNNEKEASDDDDDDDDDNEENGSNNSDIEESEDDEEEEGDGFDEDNDGLEDLKQGDSETEDENDKAVGKPKDCKGKSLSKIEKDDQPLNCSLPYTYDIPTNYESLKELLHSHTPANQGIIIERTLKYNHPKLDPSNREKTVQLFTFLLRYLNEIFNNSNDEDIKSAFQIFNNLSPSIYDLTNSNPKASQCMLELITEKYNEYKKNPKIFPGLNTIIFLKLVSNLYSTSDFRHSIVTPCFIFISHILSRARIRTRRDLSLGLFIVTVYLEYTRFSKRILPAVYNYLLGILYLCIYKKPIETFKIVPPFSSIDSLQNMLVLNEKINESDSKEEPLKIIDLKSTEVDNDFKVRVLNATLKLIKDSIENIIENIGVRYYAENFSNILQKLNITIYPDFVKNNYEKLLNILDVVTSKPLQRLLAPEKKPKCLRLMEPRIEKVVDDKRRPKLSKEKQEHAILLHKIKRETKGAVREIRRDTAFITKMKIKKQIQSDLERKEKVQRIYAEAALQQGELNALARKRKKM